MNRPCEMFSPGSNQESSPDDSGPYLAQSPAPQKRKDFRKQPPFSGPYSWSQWQRVMVGGRCPLLLPAPDLVGRTTCVQPGNQLPLV